MADQENQKKKDEIRVVDEPDVSGDDVVRLDAPTKKRIEKKGRIVSDPLLVPSAEKQAEEKEAPRPFDPEGEWIEELEATNEKVVPMGWFVLLGVILIGILGWVALQSFWQPDGPDTVSQSGDGGPLGKLEEEKAQGTAAAHFQETEDLLKAFLEAESIEERLKYVRHPERVRPLMESYHKQNDLVSYRYNRILQYQVFSLENFPFLALAVEIDDVEDEVEDDSLAILIDDSNERQLVDWESFVCYQTIAIEDLIENRPTESVSIRAYVREDYFHTFDFVSKEEYLSFQLTFRKSDEIMYGFVARGTELEKKFRKVFPKGAPKKTDPLILKVRFPEGGRSTHSVLIEDLESLKWAYAEEPAEVASSKKSQ